MAFYFEVNLTIQYTQQVLKFYWVKYILAD